MAQRKNKERKHKVDQFKNKQMEEKQPQQRFMIPETVWETTDILDLRGDLLQATQQKFLDTYHALNDAFNNLQSLGQVLQMVLNSNIKSGKVKLEYKWSDGTIPTQEEIDNYNKVIEEVRAEQQKHIDSLKKQENASKTGLTDAEGNPIGTDQNLDEDENEGNEEIPEAEAEPFKTVLGGLVDGKSEE